MEAVTIDSVINTGKTTKENKIIYEIIVNDGRKLVCSDERAKDLEIGQEQEFEIKEHKSGEYTNLWANFPGEKKQYPKKDWNYDKRKVSLQLAIESINKTETTQTTSDKILNLADKYFEYLNK